MQKSTHTRSDQSAHRIGYFDSMRGLSMILVVLGHIYLFADPETNDLSTPTAILMSFRMPLFFGISGFFAYRTLQHWSAALMKQTTIRKLRAQILCATVFYMLYQVTQHGDVLGFTHSGYGFFWFTIALFQMFVIYMMVVMLCKSFHKDYSGLILALLALPAVYLSYHPTDYQIDVVLSWSKVTRYFPYFTIGVIIRQYWNWFERLLHSDWFVTLTITVFFLGCIYCYTDGYHYPTNFIDHLFQNQIHRATGLLTVIIFFHSRARYFDGSSSVARFLRFTGKRTLDIYMMHIFFVPHLNVLSWVNTLNLPELMIIKLALCMAIAVAITALCLLLSNMLRSSHFLSVWLFGTK
ncbi:MAG: acyltransferase [Paramuribaculum sp.]|nr:acyltransferase [Paramuribaculum sp.]